MPNTVLKSKNKEAMGTNSIDEPKPETVPMISARSASNKKSACFSII
jgi:hypothetical protein